MFGLGLPEITFLVVLVGIVWVLMKRDKIRRQQTRKDARHADQAPDTLRSCPVCGIYVAVGTAQACERHDCPFGAPRSG